MVDISPFRGLLYNKEKTGDLSTVISPPYDVISDQLKKKLSGSNHYNIVNLILPEGDEDNKYSAARDLLNNWISRGVLGFDKDESYYILEIDFSIDGKKKIITGFIGLTKLEPYKNNIVLRHEKTSSIPRKDRYGLLKKCRANFGLIYTVYRDRERLITQILKSYKNREPFTEIFPYYDQNLSLRLWKITNKKDMSIITDTMRDKKILIADGHHRYETSLKYKNESSSSDSDSGSIAGIRAEDFALTLFMESSQENIKIYPTYRSIKFQDFKDFELFIQKSSVCFNIIITNIKSSADITVFLDDLKKKSVRGFIFYTRENKFYSFTAIKTEERPCKCDFSDKELDVNILHTILIRDLEYLYGKSEITFSHDFDLIIERVKNGDSDLGIFFNAPTINEMEEICNSGKLMPQKSTYFWPKLPTGLVMYKFDK
ncbi:MAG: DUF1015 domain-containing protein [Actinobacteria bacterium]|nr:DUF1015 domain-containing protein [Actinomycetota bacterium]